jgi:putative ABC transport system permease protein
MAQRCGPELLAIASLAIGWALASLVLSAFIGFRFGALPYANGEGAYRISLWYDHDSRNGTPAGTRIQNNRLTRVSAAREVTPPQYGFVTEARSYPELERNGNERRVPALAVDWDWFRELGVPVAQGRPITRADSVSGNLQVVVVSDRFWRQELEASPGAIGSALKIEGKSYEVIGVMTTAFRNPTDETDLWYPLDLTGPDWQKAEACCLRGIVTRVPAPSTADLALIEQRAAKIWNERFPSRDGTMNVEMTPMREALWQNAFGNALMPLAGSVAAGILLVGLFNFGILTLLTNLARARELGIRTALGASPTRLAAILVGRVQGYVAISVVLGVLIAWWMVDRANVLTRTIFPGWLDAHVDWRVAIAMTTLAALVGFLAALPSVLTLRKTELVPLLKLGAGGTLGKRTSGVITGLVFAELAFTVLFLPLLAQNAIVFARTQRADLGFDHKDLIRTYLTGRAATPGRSDRRAVAPDIGLRAATIPGVASVAQSSITFVTDPAAIGVVTTGGEEPRILTAVTPRVGFRSGELLRTLKIPVMAGRAPTPDEERAHAPVALISKSAAAALFGNGDAIGREVFVTQATPERTKFRIIGVIPDVQTSITGSATDQAQGVYTLLDPPYNTTGELYLRVPGLTATRLDSVRAALARVAPEVEIGNFSTIEASIDRFLGQLRITLFVALSICTIFIVLAISGVYATVGLAARLRIKEIGIRRALGATSANVGRVLLAPIASRAVLAILVGIPAGGLLAEFVSGNRYSLFEREPAFVPVTAFIALAVVIAGAIAPTIRGLRVTPMEVLRDE